MSLTATANNLAVGTYATTVNFTNWNTHVVQSLQFFLQAQQPLVVAPATGFTASAVGRRTVQRHDAKLFADECRNHCR